MSDKAESPASAKLHRGLSADIPVEDAKGIRDEADGGVEDNNTDGSAPGATGISGVIGETGVEGSPEGEDRNHSLSKGKTRGTDQSEAVEAVNEVRDERTPIDGKKLEKLLETFQSQIDLQQRQLDLLRELRTELSIPEKSTELLPTGPNEAEIEFAIKRMNARGPDRGGWDTLGRDVVGDCLSWNSLWFSRGSVLADNADFISAYGQNVIKGSAASNSGPTGQSTLMERLKHRWPANLSSQNENELVWSRGLAIWRWYMYSGYERIPWQHDGYYGWPVLRNSKENSNDTNYVSGQLIMITTSLNGAYLSLDTIAFIVLQLSARGTLMATASEEEPRTTKRDVPLWLLRCFLSDWPRPFRIDMRILNPEITIIHMFRYFSPAPGPIVPLRFNFGDIPIVREGGKFTERLTSYFVERRVGLAFVVERVPRAKGNGFSCYTCILLGDLPISLQALGDTKSEIRFTSMPLFILMKSIDAVVEHLCARWEAMLSSLDHQLSVNVTDLFDDEATRNLMFDDKSFLRSKAYFRMQQLCRIFGNTVDETIRDLRSTQAHIFDMYGETLKTSWISESGFEVLCKEWDEMTTNQIAKLSMILDRVRKKGDEVISLRDGLFNASSVKEASKSTEMAGISIRQNQYVFVFTVTTVIYLPLSFVTSIFGMHLFDTTDPGPVAAQRKFYITIAVLSLGTYIVAFLAYWLVRNRKGYMVGNGTPEQNRANESKDQEGETASGESREKIEKAKWPPRGSRANVFRRKKPAEGKNKGANDAVV